MTPLLEKINQQNGILRLIESGMSPENLKTLIRSTLDPYFENKQALEQGLLGALSVEFVNVARIVSHPSGHTFLMKVIQLYREAYVKHRDIMLRKLLECDDANQLADRAFWNSSHFKLHKNDLSLEHFRFECFRNIGELTEACLQPRIREALYMILLCKSPSVEWSTITSLDFGQAVINLKNDLNCPGLLDPEPWKLSLSQWRNIAQHHTSKIDSEEIHVWYGKPPRIRNLILKREELLQVARELFLRLRAFKCAKILFIHEHATEIVPLLPSREYEEPFEQRLLEICSKFATQGFKVIETKPDNESISISLLDLQPECLDRRVIHCSQFVVTVWLTFHKPTVEVRYLDSNGDHRWTFKSTGERLKTVIKDTQVDYERLSDMIEFVKISTLH